MGNSPLCSEGQWEDLAEGALFRAAIIDMDPKKLRRLFKQPQYKNRADAIDGDGCTMLHTLAIKGCEHDLDLAHELIRIIVVENHGSVDAHQLTHGETPLMLAIQYQNFNMIKALVETGGHESGHHDRRNRSELDLAKKEVEICAKFQHVETSGHYSKDRRKYALSKDILPYIEALEKSSMP